MITIGTLMRFPSFRNAQILAGKNNLDNEVSGVMVMEAADIELWGRQGLLLLTGYHALVDFSPTELEQFLYLAKEIGIAGFAMRLHASMLTIPQSFIVSCEKHQIPLILIHHENSFEKITTEILEPILNRDAVLLKNYYQAHREFSGLMMKQSDLNHLLENLKQMIHHPVTLVQQMQHITYETDPFLNEYEILSETEYLVENKLNFPAKKRWVHYQTFPESSYPQVVISIPQHSYEQYHLIIHELERPLMELEWPVIENAVMTIQVELVKRNAIRQYNRSRLNIMASDLLHGRLTNKDDINEAIYHLRLHPTEQYHVLLVEFHSSKQDHTYLDHHFTDALVHHSKIEFEHRRYVTRKRKVTLIVPARSQSLRTIKEKATAMVERLKKIPIYKTYHVCVTISNAVDVEHLAEGYSQAFRTQKTLQIMDQSMPIATYQDLGIYQIFIEKEHPEKLTVFIPTNLKQLQQESPDLFETLAIFLNVNQNYADAAEKLFVHPKTVRYRIDRLKESYHINLESPESILQYQISFRILKFLAAQN